MKSAKTMKHCWLFLLALALPTVGSARNDFWLGSRYSVALSFGAANLEKTNAPTPKVMPFPEYPAEMIRAGILGEVIFDYTVTSEGRISELVIVKASANEFKTSVSAVAQTWRFNPAIDLASNQPVSVRMRCKVRFFITDEEEPPSKLQPSAPGSQGPS